MIDVGDPRVQLFDSPWDKVLRLDDSETSAVKEVEICMWFLEEVVIAG